MTCLRPSPSLRYPEGGKGNRNRQVFSNVRFLVLLPGSVSGILIPDLDPAKYEKQINVFLCELWTVCTYIVNATF